MDHRPKNKSKTLEKTLGENLCDPGLGKEFLDTTPKALSIKEKY